MPLRAVCADGPVSAAATGSDLGLSLLREPRKLAKGSDTASSRAATHKACRYEEGQRRSARERRDVAAAMTNIIHKAFVTYVTTISLIGFMVFPLLAALLLLYQAAQLLKLFGIKLLALDEAHEETLHRAAKEAIDHVPDSVARRLLSG